MNYTLVGGFVVASLIGLILLLLTITGKGERGTDYFAVYDNVTGLKVGAPVFYEGYRVGSVQGLEPKREPDGVQYRVTLSIREDWGIPDNSIAQLLSSGLLADVAVSIREGDSKVVLKPGATLKSMGGGDMFTAINELAAEATILTRERIRPLVDTLNRRLDSLGESLDSSTPTILAETETLLKDLNKASRAINDVLKPENRKHIDHSLADLASTAEAAAAISKDLKTTRASLDQLLTELNAIASENRPGLRETVADLAEITSSLSQRIDAITINLESSSRNLNEFAREIRKNPNRLLFTPEADDVIVEED
ncbi:MAG: MCE family protein [Ahniella sp.]|nr:MCE family protein [Ahniella sp.]